MATQPEISAKQELTQQKQSASQTAAQASAAEQVPLEIKAPEFFIDLRPRLFKLPEFEEKTRINVRYPLLPPYAFAHIYWDEEQKELL